MDWYKEYTGERKRLKWERIAHDEVREARFLYLMLQIINQPRSVHFQIEVGSNINDDECYFGHWVGFWPWWSRELQQSEISCEKKWNCYLLASRQPIPFTQGPRPATRSGDRSKKIHSELVRRLNKHSTVTESPPRNKSPLRMDVNRLQVPMLCKWRYQYLVPRFEFALAKGYAW